jgi:hypothetical protein
MKKLLLVLFMIVAGNVACGCEWGPVRQDVQVVNIVPIYGSHYPVVPLMTNVAVIQPYVPVVVYQNVIVEKQYYYYVKTQEVVSVPRVVYVPAKY